MSTAKVTLGAQAEQSLSAAYQKNAGGSAAASFQSLEIDVMDDAGAANYTPMDLSAFAAALQNQATVTVRIAPSVTAAGDLSQKIHTSFLLAGLQANGETKQENGVRIVTAVKTAPKNNNSSAPINLILEDDLVDEDNLLADSSNLLAPPPAMSDAKMDTDDCAGREPCADCTCGRSENKADDAPKEIKTSSCGKCHLGDAFRCANCPHLGKPAFKPGEEHLTLDLQDDL